MSLEINEEILELVRGDSCTTFWKQWWALFCKCLRKWRTGQPPAAKNLKKKKSDFMCFLISNYY